MPSEQTGEHNCHQKCSYDMWCCISCGRGNISCEVKNEVNRSVIKSVRITYNDVSVKEAESFDAASEKK
jgi:heterodisulfide reductase subunit C